jgi:hypothetical protein
VQILLRTRLESKKLYGWFTFQILGLVPQEERNLLSRRARKIIKCLECCRCCDGFKVAHNGESSSQVYNIALYACTLRLYARIQEQFGAGPLRWCRGGSSPRQPATHPAPRVWHPSRSMHPHTHNCVFKQMPANSARLRVQTLKTQPFRTQPPGGTFPHTVPGVDLMHRNNRSCKFCETLR